MSGKKTEIPSKPLDATKKNVDGQNFMSVIITVAASKGYNECFGHGKKNKFSQDLLDNQFDEQGMLNGFEIPSNVGALSRRIAEGIKVLDTVLDHAHSGGPAAEGEQYPPHLNDLVKAWKTLKKGAEDTARSKTQSQLNRIVQDSVMGLRAPLGDDTNAKSRGSTRRENIQSGLVVATKGNNLPGALVDSDSDLEILEPKNDEATKTNGLKKRRSSASKVPASINKAMKSEEAIASALNNFSSSMNKKDTAEEIQMKQEMLDHTKEIENRKMTLEQDRVNKKYDYKFQKMEKETQLQQTRFLEANYNKACEKYAKCEDEYLKGIYRKEIDDSYDTWKNYQRQIMPSNNTQVPPVPALQGGGVFEA